MLNNHDKALIAFAINNFGDGHNPDATLENLDHFAQSFIRQCLHRMIKSPRTNDAAKKTAKELLEGDLKLD